MSDEILDRLDRFAADGEPDLDALVARARRRDRRRLVLQGLAGGVGLALVVVALGRLPGPPTVAIDPLADGTEATITDDGAAAAPRLGCGGVTYTQAQLDAAPLAVTIGQAVPAGAVELPAIDAEGTLFAPFVADDGWRLIVMDDEAIELLRQLPDDVDPDTVGGEVGATHEAFRAFAYEREDGSAGWHYGSVGGCVPRLVSSVGDGPLGVADLSLTRVPDPNDTVLDLLVLERGCASGQTAEGRVELVDVQLTEDEVRLVIGVRPREGASLCPSNPATPFTVELDEPVGDREVVDASVVPARPLTVDPGVPVEPSLDELVEASLSVELPTTYTMQLEMLCDQDCPATQIYELRVVDDVVVEVTTPEDPDAEVLQGLTPTLRELQQHLRTVWEAGTLEDLVPGDGGAFRGITFTAPPPGVPAGVLGWFVYDLTVG